jgi:hypothetical protein
LFCRQGWLHHAIPGTVAPQEFLIPGTVVKLAKKCTKHGYQGIVSDSGFFEFDLEWNFELQSWLWQNS